MTERAAYSRVYWTIVDDTKFDSIYDHDAHLAAWLRLLLIADQTYPASGQLPAGVKRASVKALVDAGLIDLSGSRFRIHGLDAERKRRSEPARASAIARWSQTERIANAERTQTERTANGMLDEDETRTRRGRESARATNDPWDAPEQEALAWLAKHGCDVRPGNGYHQKLILAVEQHGINAVIGKLDRLAEAGVHAGDTKGFLFGAIDALNAANRPNLREVAQAEREEVRTEDLQRRLQRTKAAAHDNGFHAEPAKGCPKCENVLA